MSTLTFIDDKRTDPTGYDAALRALNVYFGADAEAECTEDLKLLEILWDGQKCACGSCENCWRFTDKRGVMGPLSFWVHDNRVTEYSVFKESGIDAHDAVMAA